jgi:isopentenyl-diphosphate delta-isomerase
MTATPGETLDIAQRKQDHIDLCATGDVGFRTKTTLLDEVELVHDALPELSLDGVDTGLTLFGKRLSAPIFIAAMTGGTDKARAINLELARIADEEGYGFGLGSQRAMLDPARAAGPSYDVRSVAPKALVLGNIGGVQARSLSDAEIQGLVDRVSADALCVHLNPAMEIVQPGGDRDFSGIAERIAELGRSLGVPVVAKETGCGIGPAAAVKLARAGVRHVDVSGAGGTSWVAVETLRATGRERDLGAALRDWGVPTAASVLCAAQSGFDTIIATGGVATGLDVARAIALGATAAGIARPVLQALLEGGPDAARAQLARVRRELAAVMLLVGAPDLRALRRAPKLLGPRLEAYRRLTLEGAPRRVGGAAPATRTQPTRLRRWRR